MNRFISMRRHGLGERLLETYLRQPYAFFLDRHSGDLAKSILSEVDQVVGWVLGPAFRVIAASVVALALILLLVIIDPWLALGVGAAIGGMYVAVYLVVQGLLGRIGEDRTAANRERFTAASASASASPAPFTIIRQCWSSTKPPAPWTASPSGP